MNPLGDQHSRTLLLRQVSTLTGATGPASPNSRNHSPTHTPRPSSSSYAFLENEDMTDFPSLTVTNSADQENDNNSLSRPLLPSLEYEESSHDSNISVVTTEESPPNWKLWVGFVLLVITGVGNVLFAKLQALPMYNYPTFLNMVRCLRTMRIFCLTTVIFSLANPALFYSLHPHSTPTCCTFSCPLPTYYPSPPLAGSIIPSLVLI